MLTIKYSFHFFFSGGLKPQTPTRLKSAKRNTLDSSHHVCLRVCLHPSPPTPEVTASSAEAIMWGCYVPRRPLNKKSAFEHTSSGAPSINKAYYLWPPSTFRGFPWMGAIEELASLVYQEPQLVGDCRDCGSSSTVLYPRRFFRALPHQPQSQPYSR